jgi:pyruvate/2-oxoglutarate dehydrogenase complex dihydrolipoamide dehydrogenase (E3) component
VCAAGDVCSAYKFTHAADAHARIVIANALFKDRQRVSSLVIPWCTHTNPEVARVGMDEKDAAQKDIKASMLTVRLADVDRAVLDNETEGLARVLLMQGNDTILGAIIVARHAGEMIGEITPCHERRPWSFGDRQNHPPLSHTGRSDPEAGGRL